MRIKIFTLIEMLVVIAIIGILVSLLLPSLSMARNKVKDAVCLSNQKQIGILIATYSASDTGILPNHRVSATHSWPELIDATMATNLYKCPRIDQWTYSDGSSLEPDVSTPVKRTHYMTYGYNGWWLGLHLHSVGAWGQPTGKDYLYFSQVADPSKLIVISDSKPLRSGNNYSWGSSIWYPNRKSAGDTIEGVYSTHGAKDKMSNILFLDGHADAHNGQNINFNSEMNEMWNPDISVWATPHD